MFEKKRKKIRKRSFLFSGVHFGIKSGEQNRALCVGKKSQFTLKKSTGNGLSYLEYNGSHPTQGRVKKKPIPTILYEKKNNPTQCLVHLYQKYLSLRPPKDCPDDFYLRPSGNPKLDPLLFRNQAVGRHSLCQTIQRLMTSAGYVGCYSGSSIQTVHVNVSGAKYGDRRSSKIMEYPQKHTSSHSSIITPKSFTYT